MILYTDDTKIKLVSEWYQEKSMEMECVMCQTVFIYTVKIKLWKYILSPSKYLWTDVKRRKDSMSDWHKFTLYIIERSNLIIWKTAWILNLLFFLKTTYSERQCIWKSGTIKPKVWSIVVKRIAQHLRAKSADTLDKLPVHRRGCYIETNNQPHSHPHLRAI